MVLSDNLVHYWKLDESSGDYVDSTGNINITSPVGTQGVTGKISNGWQHSTQGAFNSFASTYTQFSSSTDYSFAYWIKFTSFPSANQEFFNTPALGANVLRPINTYISSTGVLTFSSAIWGGDLASVSSGTLSTGTWYHIVGTFTASTNTIELYINNSSQGTDSFTGTGNAFNSTWQLGNTIDQSTRTVDFIFDEIGMWDKTINSTEVTELYNSGDGLTYPFSASGWTGKIFGVTNPSKVNSITVANINTVNEQ